MRKIIKRAEPPSLTAHRRASNADYDNYADKQSLREALVEEQRGICCYCLSRITAGTNKMKIEHWQSQAGFAHRQLDYANLLGACLGAEGQPSEFQHCDTRKRDAVLARNPADAAHDVERLIAFGADGAIRSIDAELEQQLNDVLNLNTSRLKANRKQVLTGFLDAKRKQGTWPDTQLEKWLADWNGDTHDKELKPYCQIVVYWIRKRLKRL